MSDTRKIKYPLLAIMCTGILWAAVASQTALAVAITFNTALPLSKHEFIVREQLIISELSGDNGNLDITEVTLASVLGYGITPKWSVFTVVPTRYLQRDFGSSDNSDFGLGDATLFTRYELWRSDQRGKTLRFSPFAGIRLPTGEDGRTGDGSTDVFAGLIFTLASVDYVFDSQLSYTENRPADGFTRGDQLSFDTSFQYRLLPQKITSRTTGFLFGVLELNLEYTADNRVQGIVNDDSGGFQMFVTPGVQYTTRRWTADAAVQIPVADSTNGAIPTADYSILTSVRFNF